MSENADLKIKYSKVVPIIILLCSLLTIYVALVAGFSINTFLGLILLLVSVGMLTRNIIIIKPNQILIKNLLGMTVKSYSYTPEQIEVKKNSVYVNQKKVFSTWYTNSNSKKIKAYFLKHSESLQNDSK